MNSDLVDKIARAVLYEGYILYPYRPSALKNRQRWNFGVLYPEAFAAVQTASDRSYFQMECLVMGNAHSRLDVTLRFLHLTSRGAGERQWEEAIERSVQVRDLDLDAIVSSSHRQACSFGPLECSGEIAVSATALQGCVFRVSVRVRNTTALEISNREEALLHSLVSAHAVLTVRKGEFVSQTDPPESLREAAEKCENIGVWPVLAGEEGTHDTLLGSPIILPDYPRVAPESAGDLFDATEIDEILSLRILTMTDTEKKEMRESDERGRQILERLEANPGGHLIPLHGAVRRVGPQVGSRVRLRPRKRADIFDTLLDGKVAVVEAVEQDYEDNIHLAVVLEDDPGRDLGELRQIGHRFFFSAAEVEPLP
ncbi:MAG TPA: hypothetical protein VLI55_15240 [Bryobacteraceae bacterium]|nr:hypothetical protein [Bryobacteraceae bacterium]